jgi:hypothetical protein
VERKIHSGAFKKGATPGAVTDAVDDRGRPKDLYWSFITPATTNAANEHSQKLVGCRRRTQEHCTPHAAPHQSPAYKGEATTAPHAAVGTRNTTIAAPRRHALETCNTLLPGTTLQPENTQHPSKPGATPTDRARLGPDLTRRVQPRICRTRGTTDPQHADDHAKDAARRPSHPPSPRLLGIFGPRSGPLGLDLAHKKGSWRRRRRPGRSAAHTTTTTAESSVDVVYYPLQRSMSMTYRCVNEVSDCCLVIFRYQWSIHHLYSSTFIFYSLR